MTFTKATCSRASMLLLCTSLLSLLAAPPVLSINSTETVPGTTVSPKSTLRTSDETTTSGPEPDPTTVTAVDSLAVNMDDMGRSIMETPPANEPESEHEKTTIEPKPLSNEHPTKPSDESSAKLTYLSEPDSEHPQPAKPVGPPVMSMAQQDRFYVEASKDEQATIESWHKMAKKLKKGMGQVIGSLVPYALNMSQEAKIGSNCSGAMLKWVLSMNQLKSWAMRMLDASGKPIAGLLEGSLTMFGNYRQCLKVRAPDDDEIEFSGSFSEYFRGKYCIIQAKPWLPHKSRFYNLNTKLKGLNSQSIMGTELEDANAEQPETPWYEKTILDELGEWALAFNFVNIRMDLCVPSLCSREDIHKALNFILRGVDLKARVLRCEMESPRGMHGAASVVEGSHDMVGALAGLEAQPSPTNSAGSMASTAGSDTTDSARTWALILGWLLVPIAAIVVVLLATVVSMTIGDREEPALMDDNDLDPSSNSALGSTASQAFANATGNVPGGLSRTIKSISLKRSVSTLLKVDYDQLADDKPLALYGVRFILVVWVILVESAVNLKFEYLRELLTLKDLIFWWPMQVVINSTLQFDSFILLTGFTMAYKNVLNDNLRGLKNITRFVLDKYIRLMPSIMVLVALVILMPFIYRGPVWNDYVSHQSAVCQSTGWLNSLFLQNYLPYKDICLPYTWLLCIELQLVLLMAPLVYYLNKSYLANLETHKMSTYLDLQQPVKLAANSLATREQHGTNKSSANANRPFFWTKTTPGLVLIGCIFAGLAGSFYNVWVNELPPSWFYTMADPDSKGIYFDSHMMRLWTHLAVFAMGILAGVECRRASRNVHRGYKNFNLSVANPKSRLNERNKSQSSSSSSLPVLSSRELGSSNAESSVSINILQAERGSEASFSRKRSSIARDLVGCIVAVSTMIVIIFSTHSWSLNDLPKPVIAATFDAGSRFFWALANVWLLYMVSVPNKQKQFGFLAKTLGHPFLVALGKLSFLTYIIYPIVHTGVLAIQEQPIYSSWLMLFHILIGNLTITVILASLVSLFVEMPCRNLFRRCETSLRLTTANHQNENNNTASSTNSSSPDVVAATEASSQAPTTKKH